jgi:hypothetical protein
MAVNFIYMTAASKAEAQKIGKALVESRLAACVNILDNMQSIYRWEEEIKQDESHSFAQLRLPGHYQPADLGRLSAIFKMDRGGSQKLVPWICRPGLWLHPAAFHN